MEYLPCICLILHSQDPHHHHHPPRQLHITALVLFSGSFETQALLPAALWVRSIHSGPDPSPQPSCLSIGSGKTTKATLAPPYLWVTGLFSDCPPSMLLVAPPWLGNPPLLLISAPPHPGSTLNLRSLYDASSWTVHLLVRLWPKSSPLWRKIYWRPLSSHHRPLDAEMGPRFRSLGREEYGAMREEGDAQPDQPNQVSQPDQPHTWLLSAPSFRGLPGH